MTADTVGGVWTYALDLVRALQQWPCDVILATMGGYLNAHQLHSAAQLSNLKLYESEYKLEWMTDPWSDVTAAGRWLLEIAQREQPDLIHLNNYVHGSLPWSAPVLMVGHSCVYSWWESVKGTLPPDSWKPYHQRVALGLHCADQIVAPTHAMLGMLRRHYGPLPRGSVIHNGREQAHFRVRAKEPYVLSVGRVWDEAKNICALERIAPQLPWPVQVAGQAQCPEGERQTFANVEALGWLPQDAVAKKMARAAIYALPARYEPFGLSALEAALSGCALVLGDIDTLREVWDNSACFVPPDDEAALATTLQSLMADPARRHALALAARQRAQRYTLTAMGHAYWQAYRALLNNAQQPKLLPPPQSLRMEP